MSHCVNKSHPEFKRLVQETGLTPIILGAKVSLWQEKNDINKFPAATEVALPSQIELTSKIHRFISSLNVDIQKFGDLQEITGYGAVSATDLINKTILLSDNANTDHLAKETAYVAYALMGKKNKIVTELKHSIENMPNYSAIYNDYKSRTKLNDHKIKELIIVDFIADAIKSNFEAPKESYINRGADYWGIKSNSDLEKSLKKLIISIKKFLAELGVKIYKTLNENEVKDLIDDIANDILNNNLQKFSTELQVNQQLTNYNNTISNDPKAAKIVSDFQNIGIILTGSLALRKQGSVYRSNDENLHDLDFTVSYNLIDKELRKDIDNFNISLEGHTESAKAFMTERFSKDLQKKFKNYEWFKKVTNLYPDFKVINTFSDKGGSNATITGKIGEHIVDFFIKGNDTTDIESKTDKGFQDWIHIFIAKIRLGRAKDMLDFINWKPYSFSSDMKYSQISGMRHFTFDKELSIKEKHDVMFTLMERGDIENSCTI